MCSWRTCFNFFSFVKSNLNLGNVESVEYVELTGHCLDTEHVEYIEYAESIVNVLKMLSSTMIMSSILNAEEYVEKG